MPDEEHFDSLLHKALAHAQDPQAARVMLTHLLCYAQLRHVQDALDKVHALEALQRTDWRAAGVRLAELEAERVNFLDPNRPGE